jgi:hypothetical protein
MFVVCTGADRGLTHGLEVHAIASREVIKTLGDAPRLGSRPPTANRFAHASHERVGVAFGCVEFVFKALDVSGSLGAFHASFCPNHSPERHPPPKQ